MNKKEAISWIKEIQIGNFERNELVDEIPRGEIAISYWDDSTFSYGMEYGVIMALIKIFKVTKNDLKEKE